MNEMRLLLLAAVMAFMASCNNHGAKAEEKTETGKKPIAVKVADLATNQDLICGMKLSDGEIGDTTLYQGKIYGFCSAECKAEFLKDPQAHLTQK
jgi:YHS domain-containing protein